MTNSSMAFPRTHRTRQCAASNHRLSLTLTRTCRECQLAGTSHSCTMAFCRSRHWRWAEASSCRFSFALRRNCCERRLAATNRSDNSTFRRTCRGQRLGLNGWGKRDGGSVICTQRSLGRSRGHLAAVRCSSWRRSREDRVR